MENTALQTKPSIAVFNPSSRLAADMRDDGYILLGDYRAEVSSMVGAIRVTRSRDPDAWERHDRGDEVLVVLSGECTATLREADGRTTTRDMSKGDVLIIPRGVAHHFTLRSDEVQVFFVTPQTGTKEWSE